MTLYLVEEKAAKPMQFLYAPESGLITEQNRLFHFIPYCSETFSLKPCEISDFVMEKMPRTVFMAESSQKEKLGAKDFRKINEEALNDYFEIGSIPSADGSLAEVLFLKEKLKGMVVNRMIGTIIDENDSLLVEFNKAYPNVLEMTYIPVRKRNE